MKKLFTAIQKNDFETVQNLLLKNPELISSTLKGTPKKYDSQSPLQVALKASNTELIKLLLTFKPDVNYIEDETCINPWRAPVIHDAINRAIMQSRWNVNRSDGLEVYNDEKSADEAFEILTRLISMGADVNAKDSYGNACIDKIVNTHEPKHTSKFVLNPAYLFVNSLSKPITATKTVAAISGIIIVVNIHAPYFSFTF